MKRISLFIAFLFLVFSAWGQLNIVGVNVEKPVSKIAYLEKPIIVDSYFTKYDGLGPWSDTNMPTGNTFYHKKESPTKKIGLEAQYREYNDNRYLDDYRHWLIRDLRDAIVSDIDDALRVQNDTIYVGLPSGYYKIVGMIMYWEELESIFAGLKIAKEIMILSETETFVSGLEVHRTNIKAFESDHKELPPLTEEDIINPVKSICENVSYQLEQKYVNKKQTKKYVQEALLVDHWCPSPLFYVLEDENGHTYYYRNIEDKCNLMVDYYNNIVAELKGKKVFFSGDRDYSYKIYDYYTKTRIPINYSQYKYSEWISSDLGFASLDETLKKTSNSYKEYTCKDVVVEMTNGLEILAIIDDNEGSSFSICLPRKWKQRHWTSSSYDYKYLNLPASGLDLHSVNLYNELCQNVSKAKSVIKKELLAEQQKAEQKALAEKLAYNADIILKYGNDFGNKILNHQLAFGMTPEMCRESIGYPSRYYRSKTESGEVLIYKYIFVTLYFRDNKLVQVDDSM